MRKIYRERKIDTKRRMGIDEEKKNTGRVKDKNIEREKQRKKGGWYKRDIY